MEMTSDRFKLGFRWTFVGRQKVMSKKRQGIIRRERGMYERTEGVKKVGEVFGEKKRGWEEC